MAKCLHLPTCGGSFSDNRREVGGFKRQSRPRKKYKTAQSKESKSIRKPLNFNKKRQRNKR